MAEEPLEGIELVLLEKICQNRPVGLVHQHVVGGHIHVDIRLDGHEFLAQSDMVPGLLEHRFLPRGEFVQMVVNALY